MSTSDENLMLLLFLVFVVEKRAANSRPRGVFSLKSIFTENSDQGITHELTWCRVNYTVTI